MIQILTIVVGMSMALTMLVVISDTVKIRKIKELENKIRTMEDNVNYYDLNQRLSSVELIAINYGNTDSNFRDRIIGDRLEEIDLKMQQETERINKAIYKVQVSIADKDKFELVRKRYEEDQRHKAVMEELYSE